MKRPILMLYGELRHGGVETLIIRIANHFSAGGREVALCVPGGELLGGLHAGVTLLRWTDHDHAVDLARKWLATHEQPILLTFDPISLGLGLAAEIDVPEDRKMAHLSGVYHPQAFFMNAERSDRRWVNAQLARALGLERLYFMNEECRASHAQAWRANLSSSPLIPLPVEVRAQTWSAAKADPLTIMSVGRLVDFKRYNHNAGDIAEQLARDGIEVRWDIFGDGDDREAVEQALAKSRTSRVRLHPTLSYPSFLEQVGKAQLFVGMGTASLEAAMAGTPTLVATVGRDDSSYGFVHELPFGNVGEEQAGRPPQSLKDQIAKFASLPEFERQRLSMQGREMALRYSLDGFETAIDQLATRNAGSSTLLHKRAVALFYQCVTRSLPIRAARWLRALLRP
ncbi:glycosyltransferase [Sphingomonas sp. LHG3406-1]|uniref:glycosyltransferase n=1 Tax=Sphingomonas sp. LHG3406-1 TaxID=2804617 RepID=UPI0026072DAA|nr:glycosyltransferase [Sphingomonas sp. LHG3406-1]